MTAAGTTTATATGTTTAPATTAATVPSPVYWSHQKLMRRIVGVRIKVEDRSIRIDGATVVCGGDGRAIVRKEVPRWARFSCIQPTFPPGALAGVDALILVHPTGPTKFVVTDAQFANY
jgi:hypothetical protein